ncbi:MAG: tyrosine--tRNA ligase [Candidatus Levybacteria bacterium]|nr:tyrosine--tRNA ligase [Candidatus Levybacteria bacterium]
MKQVEEILTRGVANIIPNKNMLAGKLMSGKKLNIYLGIDPTSTKIHLGHAVVLRKLNQFALLGQNVTFLIGDFTALIGDTSDKDSERPALTIEEIEENFKTYKKQAEKILDFNKVKVRYNSEWLKKLNFVDILKLTQHFSVGDFVGRELIKKRLTDGKRVGLHEFLYPVMQGYDSYFMDTDLQIGGTDQTFNMQAGRALIRDLKEKESFVLTTVILEGTDTRKMSKSWGNAIWLDDKPFDIYRKVMAINDDLILNYLMLATNFSLEEVGRFEKRLKSKENPRDIKKELAFEIVKELVDEKSAKKAKEEFEKTVQNKEVPQNLHTITVRRDMTASEVLVNANFSQSKSEAKRLIEQGGVTVNDKKITDQNQVLEEGILKVGKKRFVKLVVK